MVALWDLEADKNSEEDAQQEAAEKKNHTHKVQDIL